MIGNVLLSRVKPPVVPVIIDISCHILAHIQARYGCTYLTCCNKMISNTDYFQKCCLCVVSSTFILASRNQTSYTMCYSYSCLHLLWFGPVPKAVLHQPLGPLICYKGCRHTEDTQLSKLRYITAFHNTPPSSIWEDQKVGRGCRPSSKAPTNCQQELLRPGLTTTSKTPLPNSQQNLPQPGQPTQLHRDPVERLLPHQPSRALPCPSEFARYTAAQQEVPSDGWTP